MSQLTRHLAGQDIPDAGHVLHCCLVRTFVPVGAEGHGLHQTVMRQLIKLLAVRHPRHCRFVIAARQNFVPSGLKSTARTGQYRQLMDLLASREHPRRGPFVSAARSATLVPSGLKATALHRAIVRQLMKLLAARYIPDAVSVGRPSLPCHNLNSIWAERHGPYHAIMRQQMNLLAASIFPDAGHVVRAARSQP